MYKQTLFKLPKPNEKSNVPSLPKIDVDNFNQEEIAIALRDYGTYELVGKSIDALRYLANTTLKASKNILRLYDKTSTVKKLKAVSAANFNGFQDVRAETEERVRKGTEPAIRNQIAFHFKPYEGVSKIPAGTEPEVAEILRKYYSAAEAVLKKHYTDIANHFISREYISSLFFDEAQEKNVLMMRRYFAPTFEQFADDEEGKKEKAQKASLSPITKTTGIPSHSDHGLVTLVTSDAPGLEVYTGGQWIPGSYHPEKLTFFINFGDWALFEILASIKKYPDKYKNNNFKEGLHRVPHIDHERYSLIFALNPHKNEVRPTPLGGEVSYQTFLQGKKGDFRDISRDESANYHSKQIEILALKNLTPLPDFTPNLYVVESVDFGQETWKFVKGNGEILCSVASENTPAKANEGFSYAYINIDDAFTQSKLPRSHGNDLRVLRVKLKYADDIYVVNELTAEKLEGNDARIAIAQTLIPLKDYKGNYEKPVYLIQRGLQGGNEADDITSESRKLIEYYNQEQDKPSVLKLHN